MEVYEELIEEIRGKTKLSKEEIEKRIEDKIIDLSDLISKEGAAYLVARELGINLIKDNIRRLKIKNIVPGLSSITIIGRVIKIFPLKEFVKNERKGKFLSVLLGDDTGTIRLVLWDSDSQLIEKNKIKEGDIVKISACFTRAVSYTHLTLPTKA